MPAHKFRRGFCTLVLFICSGTRRLNLSPYYPEPTPDPQPPPSSQFTTTFHQFHEGSIYITQHKLMKYINVLWFDCSFIRDTRTTTSFSQSNFSLFQIQASSINMRSIHNNLTLYSLKVGSPVLVEVINKTGVIRWVGQLPHAEELIAGIEMVRLPLTLM